MRLPKHHGLKTAINGEGHKGLGLYIDRFHWKLFGQICREKYGISRSEMIRQWVSDFLIKENQ